ncbi:MAG: L-2-hydroxyglutarate oxidase [Saprospiraceae bacterium]
MTDISIIGAGIVGLATGYQLLQAKPDLSIHIFEKETDVAKHQTSHNSGVIHSGIYYKPGSLKATNCQKGYRMLIDFCDQHHIPYDLCGKVIVATSEKERPQLDIILEKGLKNGMVGIEKIGPEATLEIEPNVNVVEAIKVPQAGIIDYEVVALKLAELIEQKGGQIHTNAKVIGIRQGKGIKKILDTTQGTFETDLLVNCAGLYADKVAHLTGQKTDFKVLPFRGEFYELLTEKRHLVNHLIYPVPNPNFPFLGVHFTRMIKGGIEAGPNAVLAFRREGYSHWDIHVPELVETLAYPGFQRLASKYWRDGLGELHRSFSKTAFVSALQHLIPAINYGDLERGRSGVRAQAVDRNGNMVDDYLILQSPGVINVCNAPSPAATSALSIGETLANCCFNHIN